MLLPTDHLIPGFQGETKITQDVPQSAQRMIPACRETLVDGESRHTAETED